MINSPSFSSLPLLLSLAGCAQSCHPDATKIAEKASPTSTGYDLPCEFTLDMTAFAKDNNAEVQRLLKTIELCDQGIETQSKVGLKGVLASNCAPGDRKLYSTAPTDMAEDPGFMADLAKHTNLAYVTEHPDSVYNWNAKLYDCQEMTLSSDPSKKGQLCTALFTEFSHAQVTTVSFVDLLCTQDSEVVANALANGASSELDLSKFRVGLNPEVVLDHMVRNSQ
jgi:hypothetical protein